MSNTTKIPTDKFGSPYFGPASLGDAASLVLRRARGSYIEDEDGRPLSDGAIRRHWRAEVADSMERHGFDEIAAKLRTMTRTQMEEAADA